MCRAQRGLGRGSRTPPNPPPAVSQEARSTSGNRAGSTPAARADGRAETPATVLVDDEAEGR